MHNRPGGTPATYCLAGLRLESEIALGHDAPPADDASIETIEIRQTRLPRTLSSAVATFPVGQCNRDELLIHLPGVASCLTRNGREILVDPDADADRGELRSHLLGTMFGVLCHQRRILPLHCSAIAAEGGTGAFVGGRGTGKSTLVASLLARGHRFVADDVCFLRLDQRQTVQAWPGVRHVLLPDDAMQALNGRGPRGTIADFRREIIPLLIGSAASVSDGDHGC